MPSQSIVLQPTLGGLDRSKGYQAQAPFTTRDALNARGSDTYEDRERIGQRPGLVKYSDTELGSGSPIRSLHQVDTIEDDAITTSGTDSFKVAGTTLGAGWNTAAWCDNQPGVVDRADPLASSSWNNDFSGAGVRDAVNIDLTEDYRVELDIVPFDHEYKNIYYIYARMNNTTPDIRTEGIEAVLQLDDRSTVGTYSGALIEWNAGIPTVHAFAGGSLGYSRSGTFSVLVSTDTITVTWAGVTLLNAQAVSNHTGTRVGFGMGCLIANWATVVDRFAVIGTPLAPLPAHQRRTRLLAVSDGKLYYENTPMNFSQISGPTLSSTHALSMCQGAQKAYLAEYNVSGTGLIYEIDPKVPSATALTATYGSIPANAYVVQIYLDRLFVISSNQWYCSRQGDYTDWNTVATDVGRAVNGQNSDAGRIAESIRAAIAWSDDTMLFGSQNTLYALRGDPADGGMIDVISKNYGIIDRFANCFGREGELYGLSRAGVFFLPPGGQGRPEGVSDKPLPVELRDINTAEYEITMAYNDEEHGVNIFLTPYLDTEVYHWFLDLGNGAWWRDSFSRDHQPTSTHYLRTDIDGLSGMIIGCRDGYIRRFSTSSVLDDDTNIDSYVEFGPIALGATGYEGLLNEMVAIVPEPSGDIDWTLTTAYNAEQLYGGSTRVWTGTWDQKGVNYTSRPRARGAAMKLRVGNDGETSWALEQVHVTRERAGKLLLP